MIDSARAEEPREASLAVIHAEQFRDSLVASYARAERDEAVVAALKEARHGVPFDEDVLAAFLEDLTVGRSPGGYFLLPVLVYTHSIADVASAGPFLDYRIMTAGYLESEGLIGREEFHAALAEDLGKLFVLPDDWRVAPVSVDHPGMIGRTLIFVHKALTEMDLQMAAPLIEGMLGMAALDNPSLEYRRRSGDHSEQLLSERLVMDAREAYGEDACVIWESYLRSFTTWSARAGHHGGKGIARDLPVSEMDEQLLTNFREVLEAWKADCATDPAEREVLLREVLDTVTERRATVDEEYSARFERITAEHAELAAEMGEEYPGAPPPPLAPWELLQLDAVRELLLEELDGDG